MAKYLFDRFRLQFFAEGDDDHKSASGNEETPPGGSGAFTQADVDRIIADRLRREREKYSDYEDLKKAKEELDRRKQEEMTEVERLKSQLAESEKAKGDVEARVRALEIDTLKAKFLEAEGLPVSLASRVFGEDEEAIKADVAKLKEFIKIPNKELGGGGVPAAGQSQKNPWKRDSLNLTEQARILRENPALAVSLKADAGV